MRAGTDWQDVLNYRNISSGMNIVTGMPYVRMMPELFAVAEKNLFSIVLRQDIQSSASS